MSNNGKEIENLNRDNLDVKEREGRRDVKPYATFQTDKLFGDRPMRTIVLNRAALLFCAIVASAIAACDSNRADNPDENAATRAAMALSSQIAAPAAHMS